MLYLHLKVFVRVCIIRNLISINSTAPHLIFKLILAYGYGFIYIRDLYRYTYTHKFVHAVIMCVVVKLTYFVVFFYSFHPCHTHTGLIDVLFFVTVCVCNPSPPKLHKGSNLLL